MTEATFRLRETARKAREAQRDRLRNIPYEYGDILQNGPRAYLKSVRLLPYEKEEIIRAFLFCIANAKTKLEIDVLQAALLTVPYFQDIGELSFASLPNQEDFEIETEDGFAELAKEVSNFTELRDIVRPQMAYDFEFIDKWMEKAVDVNEFVWPKYRVWFEQFKANFNFHFRDGPYRKIPAKVIDFPS